jgi:putative spermidine/putrescine transport system permease protein
MRKKFPVILLLPSILLGALLLAGAGSAIVQSLGYIPALGLYDVTFSYYAAVFTRPEFVSSIALSLFIAAVSSAIAAGGGILLSAALVSGRRVSARLVRLPILVPHTVVALFVIMIFSGSGLLSRTLYDFGIIGSPDAFPPVLFNANGAGVILAYLWKEIPFIAYFTLALMSSVSRTLGEAAGNLGASGFKTFLHVTLPLSMPAVKKAFLITFAFSFGAYELPYLLGATLPRALPVQAYIEYLNPDLQNRPYAMALNGVMLLVALIVAVLYYRLMKKDLQGGKRYD